ncbi:MAG: PIN domain-containing protein [Verrucomicrobiota bacterium]
MVVFLDANILFSASNDRSGLQRLVTYLAENHKVISSNYARDEAYRNVCAKRPAWLDAYGELEKLVRFVSDIDVELEVEIAEKDRPILASAIAHKSDILLTGDKRDFSHLFGISVQGVKVLSPAMLVDQLKDEGS